MRSGATGIGFLLISLRNLQRNLKRNLATGSAIAIGFAGIFLLSAYYNRAYHYLKTYTIFANHTGHAAIYASKGLASYDFDRRGFSLTPEQQDEIETFLKTDPRVDFYEKQIWGAGLIGNGCASIPMIIQGYEPEIDRRALSHPDTAKWTPKYRGQTKGRALSEFPADLAPIKVTETVGKTLGKIRVHDEFPAETVVPVNCGETGFKEKYSQDANVQLMSATWSGSMNALDGEVVAHFRTGFDQTDGLLVVAPRALVQKLFDTENIARFSIWLKDSGSTSGFVRDFKKAHPQFEAYPWDDPELSPYFYGTMKFLLVLVTFLSVILGLVVGLSVLNSMTMTILERSAEIGTYRALGFRARQVRRLFLLEALWLCGFSIAAGLVMGLIFVQSINGMHVIYNPPGISGGMELMLVGDFLKTVLIATILLGLVLLCTFISARRRSMVSPVELLGGPLR